MLSLIVFLIHLTINYFSELFDQYSIRLVSCFDAKDDQLS